MTKPVGGRGQKAPYETVQVRCPVPIKSEVDMLISRYRESVLNGSENQNTNAIDSSESQMILNECIRLVNQFIEERNIRDLTTRNNVNLIRFREWLQSQTNQNTV